MEGIRAKAWHNEGRGRWEESWRCVFKQVVAACRRKCLLILFLLIHARMQRNVFMFCKLGRAKEVWKGRCLSAQALFHATHHTKHTQAHRHTEPCHCLTIHAMPCPVSCPVCLPCHHRPTHAPTTSVTLLGSAWPAWKKPRAREYKRSLKRC